MLVDTNSLSPRSIADAIASRRGGVGLAQSGGQWTTWCPCHDDTTTPSLTLNEEDGRLLVTCRAGCDQGEVVGWLKDHHLWPAGGRIKSRKVVDTYIYESLTEDGDWRTVARKLRYDEEGQGKFKVEWVGEDGETLSKAPKGARLPLFGLRRLLGADPDQPVLLVEGEKDVRNATALGLVAVSGPTGGGSDWHPSWSKPLQGRDVVILPDNDETGRKMAATVARAVSSWARSVRVLQLPGLPAKGDLSDWIEAGGTASELLTLVEQSAGELEVPWSDQLLRRGRNAEIIADTESNIALILDNDPEFRGRLAYNEFQQQLEWRQDEASPWRPITDADDVRLLVRLQRWRGAGEAEFAPTLGRLRSAIADVAHQYSYDPLMDYINGLPEWDGVDRLSGFFTNYCSSEDDGGDGYLETVAKVWMVMGIARALEPGCKSDQWLVLKSYQGAKKSMMAEALCPVSDWFTDNLPNIERQPNEARIALQGRWIVEVAELDAFSRSRWEAIKGFTTSRIDKLRMPYGRHVESFPRRCVMICTTNEQHFLGDVTGNRRFLPVGIGLVDAEAVRRDRDQIWAQARELYRQGYQRWIEADDPRLLDRLEQHEREFSVRETIERYIEEKPERNHLGALEWEERPVTLDKIKLRWFIQDVFGRSQDEVQGVLVTQIRGSLTQMGWDMKRGLRDATQAEEHGDNPRAPFTGYVPGPKWTRRKERKAWLPNSEMASQKSLDFESESNNNHTANKVISEDGATGGEKQASEGSQEATRKPQGSHRKSPERKAFSSMATLATLNSENTFKENRGNAYSVFLEPFRGEVARKPSPSDAVAAFLSDVPVDAAIGLDLETTSLRPQDGRCRLLQMWYEGQGIAIDLDQVEGGLTTVGGWIKDRTLVAWNASFEAMWLIAAGVTPTDLHDAQLLHAASRGAGTSLKQAAREVLGEDVDKAQQLSDWSGDLSEDQITYAIKDAELARRLWQALAATVSDEVYEGYSLMQGAILPVASMTVNGFRFDAEGHRALIEAHQQEYDRLTAVLEASGAVDNWASPVQIGEWLRKELPSTVAARWPRTNARKLSTAADAVTEGLGIGGVPEGVRTLLRAFSERQGHATILKTFGEGLAERVCDDGRLRGDFRIAGAVTGRMSSANPNLQNMPREGFRELFTAEPGYALVVADYSQIEVRVGGLLAGEERVAKLFREGHDFHRATAAQMLGIDAEDVTDEQRRVAKAVTFGVQYGMGAKSLAKQLGVSVKEAEQHITTWEKTYPEIAQWRRERIAEINTGVVRTAGGREIRGGGRLSATAAVNWPVQGSAADVMYAALGALWQRLDLMPDVQVLAVVHDEVVLEVPLDEVEDAAKVLERSMVEGMLRVFPDADTTGLVEAHHGPTWAGAKQ